MINSKYMAAAYGANNSASKLTGNINIPRPASKPIGNTAGLDNGRSTWVQMDGTGYKNRAKGGMSGGSSVSAYRAKPRASVTSTNYTRPKYHGVTKDKDLSKRL